MQPTREISNEELAEMTGAKPLTKKDAMRLRDKVERLLRDPGNANGPRVPKPSAAKLKRKRAKAARKRNRGAYRG